MHRNGMRVPSHIVCIGRYKTCRWVHEPLQPAPRRFEYGSLLAHWHTPEQSRPSAHQLCPTSSSYRLSSVQRASATVVVTGNRHSDRSYVEIATLRTGLETSRPRKPREPVDTRETSACSERSPELPFASSTAVSCTGLGLTNHDEVVIIAVAPRSRSAGHCRR